MFPLQNHPAVHAKNDLAFQCVCISWGSLRYRKVCVEHPCIYIILPLSVLSTRFPSGRCISPFSHTIHSRAWRHWNLGCFTWPKCMSSSGLSLCTYEYFSNAELFAAADGWQIVMGAGVTCVRIDSIVLNLSWFLARSLGWRQGGTAITWDAKSIVSSVLLALMSTFLKSTISAAFSGNRTRICSVGWLTNKLYRYTHDCLSARYSFFNPMATPSGLCEIDSCAWWSDPPILFIAICRVIMNNMWHGAIIDVFNRAPCHSTKNTGPCRKHYICDRVRVFVSLKLCCVEVLWFLISIKVAVYRLLFNW